MDTPILTPTGSQKLGKKYCAIDWHYPTNAFNLTLTASAQRKKPNTVFLGLDDFVRRGDRNLDLSLNIRRSVKFLLCLGLKGDRNLDLSLNIRPNMRIGFRI
ncbi:hypothetical protein [Microcoleus sp. B9-D4]|uniref:hypothetical protein n=1 Tax=Microcoleus sp. B9-D4 TaxID=2818711 RepID=UPI002FD525C1